MGKKPVNYEFRFRSGVILSQNKALILAGHHTLEDENVAHSFAFLWERDSEWQGRRIGWTSSIVTNSPNDHNQGLIIGEDGQYSQWSDKSELETRLETPCILRGASVIDDKVFVVGMRSTIYKLHQSGNWEKVALNSESLADFEDITGFSEDELYLVGWEGTICLLKSQKCTFIEAPTNLILTSACCSDGYVYCCGQKGMLLKGRGEIWEIIHQEQTTEDFWSIVSFQNSVYVASASLLYQLIDDELRLVHFDTDIPKSFYHLSTYRDSVMWSVGSSDVMLFDGDKWERII